LPRLRFVSSLVIAALTLQVSWAQATIILLQHPDANGRRSSADGVSHDGTYVAGSAQKLSGGSGAVLWRAGQPMWIDEPIGHAEGGLAGAVSDDGLTVVVSRNDGYYNRAYRWREGEGLTSLGQLGNLSIVFPGGMSADGRVIVGYCQASLFGPSRAFRWEDTMVDIGALPGESSAAALDASADGEVIVGYCRGTLDKAFLYTEALGMQALSLLPGTNQSLAIAVSADGGTVIGLCRTGSSERPCLWSSGVAVEIPRLHGYPAHQAVDVSGDGSTVIGWAQGSGPLVSTLWSYQTGTVDLRDYLAAHGCDMLGFNLIHVKGISADGRYVVGRVPIGGQDRGFIAGPLTHDVSVEELSPISQAVSIGRLNSGNLASLATDDNDPQVLCKFIVPFLGSPIMSTDLTFRKTLATPNSAALKLKVRALDQGPYQIATYQYHYPTQTWAPTQWPIPLGDVYTTLRSIVPGVLGNHIQSGTGEMKARIAVFQTGPSATASSCVGIEYARQVVGGR
jgi:uncharacterized membrane protein